MKRVLRLLAGLSGLVLAASPAAAAVHAHLGHERRPGLDARWWHEPAPRPLPGGEHWRASSTVRATGAGESARRAPAA
jgi:hypothetical protein